VTGYMGTITDITDLKNAEVSIRESEERLRIAMNAGHIGVWDWDIVHNTLTWTDNVYNIHGVTQRNFKVSFDNYIKTIHPDDYPRWQDAINRSIKGESPFAMEFRTIRPTGEIRWVSTGAYISYDESGKAVRMLGATTDITERKQLEQDKNDFLSMASHELKTPLTSMKIFIDLLSTQVEHDTSDKPKYFINRIRDQANRLTELTSDLLDVSRIDTGKLRLSKETFRLDELVTDTIEGIQPSAKQHTLIIKSKSAVSVYADRYRLYQVLVNLLTNAVKYSPKGNEIIVTVGKQKGRVVVRVKDFGIGINKVQQKKIFDRLYQVTDPEEKTYPGLGLGLYISKEIIERHNGKIWVESEGKGKGAIFIFTLPENKVE
jgi:two-component system CheB/CheR fusion protein